MTELGQSVVWKPGDRVETNIPGEFGIVIAYAFPRALPDRYSVPVLLDDPEKWRDDLPVVMFAPVDLTSRGHSE